MFAIQIKERREGKLGRSRREGGIKRGGAERKGEVRKGTNEKRGEENATSTSLIGDCTPAEPKVVATYATVPARIAAVATERMT
jgi:hypothetical protein